MSANLQRNATWMAERIIAQMGYQERDEFDIERKADGWAGEVKQHLQDWPTDFMGPRPTVTSVLAQMESIYFQARPYVTMPTLTTRERLGNAGYVCQLLVGTKDGRPIADSEHNAIEILLQENIMPERSTHAE